MKSNSKLTMKKNKNILNLLIFLFIIMLISSCEDTPPTDYVPQYYVEAFLIVDQPIDMIKLLRTQPLQDSFRLSKALVKDATVKIRFNNQEITLAFRDTGNLDNWAYFYPDTSLKVLPNTQYELEITTPDNVKITGTTITPERFEWVIPPPDSLFYPKDTTKFSDRKPAKIKWSPVKNMLYYLVVTKCLDSLEYGKYLVPPNNEKNRRVFNPFDNERRRTRDYYDLSLWDAIPNVEYEIYWLLFKWFGKHKIIVFAPDYNFLRWVLQQFRANQINPLLSSVNGAIGVFGSASKIEKEIFLFKNQP
jgi:hypothetical protein